MRGILYILLFGKFSWVSFRHLVISLRQRRSQRGPSSCLKLAVNSPYEYWSCRPASLWYSANLVRSNRLQPLLRLGNRIQAIISRRCEMQCWYYASIFRTTWQRRSSFPKSHPINNQKRRYDLNILRYHRSSSSGYDCAYVHMDQTCHEDKRYGISLTK